MDFLKAIEAERARLTQSLDDLQKQRGEIDTKISAINAELKAINAYEAAKTGKKKAAGKRSNGITTQVTTLLKTKPMTRAQILEALGAKGNKTIEQSVSNALTNLKKKNKLTAKDGVYSST